ncbi:unnamed protein product [Caretta caretta]
MDGIGVYPDYTSCLLESSEVERKLQQDVTSLDQKKEAEEEEEKGLMAHQHSLM